MNFAAHQDKARSNTFWLIVIYIVGVLGLSLAALLVVDVILEGNSPYGGASASLGASFPASLYESVFSLRFAAILGGFIAFLLGAAGIKSLQLDAGGRSVAESMGGRLVSPQTTDPLERRLRNVVEEMALSSGIPVPPVYILDDEQGINAFAAGFTVNDAVIGVTRGAVTHFSRAELQAVVGHEFSHVLNGDMRLNIRFTALLFGLLCLMEIGRMIMQMTPRRSRGRDDGKAFAAIMLIALVAYALGALTSFLGHIIQAAVNRQREFLADASAVQFTRSLDLASALKKIGGAKSGSQLESAAAGNYRHFFFCQADSNLFATHPPLAERIKRIDPSWDGRFTAEVPSAENVSAARQEKVHTQELEKEQVWHTHRNNLLSWAALGAKIPAGQREAEGALQQTNPSEASLVQPLAPMGSAAVQMDRAALFEACYEPLDACCLIFALLLDKNPDIRNRQLTMVSNSSMVLAYDQKLSSVTLHEYVTLIEKALPALKTLSESQYRAFQATLEKMIYEDNRFSFKEWLLYQLIVRQVGMQYERGKGRKPQPVRADAGERAVRALLSTLARLEGDGTTAQRAFSAGLKELGMPDAPLSDKEKAVALGEHLKLLQQSPQAVREAFVRAALCVARDNGFVGPEEEVWVRVVSLCLDCPVALVA